MVQKSILITGCSSGIGLCAAKTLQKRGYRVFATARKPADIEMLKAENLESILLDVTDPNSIKVALDQILARTGGTLDAVFNNAGYMQAGALEDMTDDLDRAQFETNFFGAINITRAVLPVMRQQGHGRIVQNSSILGVICMPYYGAYNASKHALEAYTTTLRQELRGTGIHVSLINPGPITTKLRDTAHVHFKDASLQQHQTGHHEHAYQAMEKSYFNRSDSVPDISQEPEAVVAALIAALESKRPRAHYFVGKPAKILAFARRILPDCAMDGLIAKIKSSK